MASSYSRSRSYQSDDTYNKIDSLMTLLIEQIKDVIDRSYTPDDRDGYEHLELVLAAIPEQFLTMLNRHNLRVIGMEPRIRTALEFRHNRHSYIKEVVAKAEITNLDLRAMNTLPEEDFQDDLGKQHIANRLSDSLVEGLRRRIANQLFAILNEKNP